MIKLVPVTFEYLGGKNLLPLKSYTFAAKQHLAPLLATEFTLAAHCFPIVFSKQQDAFTALGMFGLKPGTNLLVDQKGRWLTSYVPAIFRRYPFAFAHPDASDNTKFMLCIDETSDLLTDEGGQPLYTAKGKPSETLKKAMAFVTEFQKQVPIGEQLCKMLQNFNLFEPFNLKLQFGEKTVSIEGFFQVDEEKLRALPDEDFLVVRSSGMLPLIYAHLFSLSQVSVLTDKLKRTVETKKANVIPMPESFKF